MRAMKKASGTMKPSIKKSLSRRLTKEGREAISRAQQKRWKAYRRDKKAGVAVGKKKPKAMAAGR